jgi:UDP-N-acetylglucosamine transferase subunit ALG13
LKIYLTVGTSKPFDRLVRACDALAATGAGDDWLAQIHTGSYEPRHMRYERAMDKAQWDAAMIEADAIVGHAGMGTISGALALEKPLLVMPRRRVHGESVNDHQVAGAEHFRAGGHLLVALDVGDLGPGLDALRTFVPVARRIEAARLADDIGDFLRRC